MIKDIFKSIKAGNAIYNSLKQGNSIKITESKTLPTTTLFSFANTLEGNMLLSSDIENYNTVKACFNTLQNHIQRRLMFTPNEGEFIERINLWKQLLKPELPEKDYYKVIHKIYKKYIKLKNRRAKNDCY